MIRALRALLRPRPPRSPDPHDRAEAAGPLAAPPASPAPQLHELLFGDRDQPFRPAPGEAAADWQRLLFDDADTDAAAVRALADDPLRDSRVRALAWGWLRARQQPVPGDLLLGLVAEVAVGGGVDVLAAYADGRVRLLHHSGRLVLADAPVPAYAAPVGTWLAAGATALDRAAPWQRRPGALPGPGQARLVWIAADGLRMREGRFEDLLRDPTTGPALLAASQLLQVVTGSVR